MSNNQAPNLSLSWWTDAISLSSLSNQVKHCSPLNCSQSWNWRIHLLLSSSGIGEVQSSVAMMVSLRISLASASTGPSFPVMSKMLANFELTIFLVSFLGTNWSMVWRSPEKNLVPSWSLPLLFWPKWRGGIFVSKTSQNVRETRFKVCSK